MMANDYRQGFKPRPNEFPEVLAQIQKIFQGEPRDIYCLVGYMEAIFSNFTK